MKRRLTAALVGMALASILLVGLGVLLFARSGARNDARERVSNQLEAIDEVFAEGQERRNPGALLPRLRDAFGADSIEFVIVDSTGQVNEVRANGGAGGGGSGGVGRRAAVGPVSFVLSEEQNAVFLTGEAVLIDNSDAVVGLREVVLADNEDTLRRIDAVLAVRIEESVATLGADSTWWFLISGGAVLVSAAVLAQWLASRFTAPVAAIRDATERIAKGDLQTRVETTSNDEIGELGQSVNAMDTSLERSQAVERQFLMSISHDLRTPLTAITGHGEGLADGTLTDAARSGEVITNHAHRLNRLVGDLLDLARLDAHQFTLSLRDIDPQDAVERTVAGFRPTAETAGVELKLVRSPHELVAELDRDRLAQILSNLMENALKYAETLITLEVATAGENRVAISVTDDGPGIAEADLPFVFDRLYVTSATPRRAENSSGLGLAIVRQLAQAMDGDVSVSSTFGTSTTFTVWFPLS